MFGNSIQTLPPSAPKLSIALTLQTDGGGRWGLFVCLFSVKSFLLKEKALYEDKEVCHFLLPGEVLLLHSSSTASA